MLSIKKCTLLLVLLGVACKSDEPTNFSTVLGRWDYSISVPPTAPGVHNSIEFRGNEMNGTFEDKNGHTGDWHMEADSIFWTYLNVPGLTNLYKGKVSADFRTMSGTHSGVFNGDAYMGKWSGSRAD